MISGVRRLIQSYQMACVCIIMFCARMPFLLAPGVKEADRISMDHGSLKA